MRVLSVSLMYRKRKVTSFILLFGCWVKVGCFLAFIFLILRFITNAVVVNCCKSSIIYFNWNYYKEMSPGDLLSETYIWVQRKERGN